MDENLAARIRALPEHIRGELSVVPGPGWLLQARRVEGAPYAPEVRTVVPRLLPSGDAWWPASPVDAVAAVRGWDLATTLEALQVHAEADPEKGLHELALDILEAPSWWADEGRSKE